MGTERESEVGGETERVSEGARRGQEKVAEQGCHQNTQAHTRDVRACLQWMRWSTRTTHRTTERALHAEPAAKGEAEVDKAR